MSAAPTGPIFAGYLFSVGKALNDAYTLANMPPPTVEFRACWQCGGTKYLDDRMCRLCDYRGQIQVEVRR
jgi:hypothetical protein